MVKAKKKPISELKAVIEPFHNVLNIGCGGCVSVCLAGVLLRHNILKQKCQYICFKKTHIENFLELPLNYNFLLLFGLCRNFKPPVSRVVVESKFLVRYS
jgi:ferredoxin